MTTINTAIFAYNEQRTIRRALRSVGEAAPAGAEVRVFVMINGCTDRTADVVREYAADHPEVTPVEIGFGDKCNAWNYYVHELADEDAEAHFFMDGDCWCSPKAIAKMLTLLWDNPQATVVAGTPQSGRNRHKYIQLQREHGWVFGGLYGVRTERLQEIRRRELRLPIGLKGNDHFVTRMVLAPLPNLRDRDPKQAVLNEQAGYVCDPLRPYHPGELRAYWNRQITYELRQRQIPLLQPLALDELPETVDEVNQRILADLRKSGTAWHPVRRAVRRKLERMYPTPDAAFYRDKLRTAEPPVVGTLLQPETVSS